MELLRINRDWPTLFNLRVREISKPGKPQYITATRRRNPSAYVLLDVASHTPRQAYRSAYLT